MPFTASELQAFVAAFKQDPRGPFQGIRWFCPDGTRVLPQERCAEPGGIQHALLKDVVVRVQERNHLYLGQILAGTPYDAFLDESHFFARLKHYQIERYLAAVDNGWIFRRAQFYRGAFQAEDEEKWGMEFLTWLAARRDLIQSRYFLLREAVRDIPHRSADNAVQQIRGLSKELSDEYAPFMDVRIKIHGQPDASDTLRVARFMADHRTRLGQDQRQRFDRLLAQMRTYYRIDPMQQVKQGAARLPVETRTAGLLSSLQTLPADPVRRAQVLSNLMIATRSDALEVTRPADRLRLLDISLAVESMFFRTVSSWQPDTQREQWQKAFFLAQAAAGSGLLEFWEWNALRPSLEPTRDRSISVDRYGAMVEASKRAVEWGIGMVMAVYEEEVARFTDFEPLAAGFIDDRLRSTLLLPLGDVSSALGLHLARLSGVQNEVMGLAQSSGIRGLNPGVSVGRLVVVNGPGEISDFRTDEIYVMDRAPSELKPVAGIATVSEGNRVSHVQLLARNLGIPNAVVSPDLLRSLAEFSGQRVFYAVSPGGAVRIKPASAMTPEERSLIEERQRSETRIRVPTDRLNLSNSRLTSLFELRARDSGVVCGPKAANLGQLSSLFPGKVAPGFIIPFGVFRNHMNQRMPASQLTYWDFLRSIFQEADQRRARGETDERVESFVLERLAILRTTIEEMPLLPDFIASLRAQFRNEFGNGLGQIPIFVRSDTNMEDLKDFTGAGLNLTVPNVLTEEAVLQAIRRVWASPYRERGYRWRQKYLLNPEDVYPSLLILQSVNVEKSGVLITTGISTGNPEDFTVAFNRGVGGAVDGQAAESYTLTADSYDLLAPAREPSFTALSPQGGTIRKMTSFETRILSEADLQALRDVAMQVRRRLPGTPGIETDGPFDVELGLLNGQVYLFQARPFVQNRAAGSTHYLAAMDQRTQRQRTVDLDAVR